MVAFLFCPKCGKKLKEAIFDIRIDDIITMECSVCGDFRIKLIKILSHQKRWSKIK